MSLEIKVEKALKGECIWIRYGDEKITNIIIDSGPASFVKGFKELINKIKIKEEFIDLLILTHIDNDHIKGLDKYISYNECNIIKKVWLNGEGCNTYTNNMIHSAKNIYSLVTKLKEKKINVITPIKEGHIENINNAKLTVITPTLDAIFNVAEEIDKFKQHSSDSKIAKDLDEIIKEDKFVKDESVNNKASIAFILSYQNKNIAFLGDAHVEDVILGRNKFFKDKPIYMLKLSHHGSKYNINKDLLKCINTNKFIISTKGPVHKETISRIVDYTNNVKIYCNYDWWTKNNFFTKNDKEKYIKSKKLNMILLNEDEKIEVKEG